MTPPIVREVRAVAIRRLDPDGRGIHLAWSGPGPRAARAQRVRGPPPKVRADEDHARLRRPERRAACDARAGRLHARCARHDPLPRRRLAARRGRRCRARSGVACGSGSRLRSPAGGRLHPGTRPSDGPRQRRLRKQALARRRAQRGQGRRAARRSADDPVALTGMEIDTVVVYAVAPSSLQICADAPADPAGDEHDGSRPR